MTGSLGRHVEHDPLSRGYPAATAAAVRSVQWLRRSPIFDQDKPKPLGSCTGNAAAGWLATDNAARLGRTDLTEQTAVEIYSKATHLDSIPGSYPPDDTGSSGLAVAKAMRALGLTTGPYRHAFGLQHALEALQSGPVLVGIEWLTDCDSPDPSGLVRYSGTVRGGHEILADALDVTTQVVWFQNSWGTRWGRHGRFCMSISDFGRALSRQGDVTVPS